MSLISKKLVVGPNKTIEQCLKIMKQCNVKCLVVAESGKLKGTLSDGDIRKAFLKKKEIKSQINNVYNSNCKFFYSDKYKLEHVKKLIINKRYDVAPIVDKNKKIVDIITWETFSKNKLRKRAKISLPVVIMAGGQGTRLKPFTNVLPKALIPVNEKTIIENIIENFRHHSINDFNISISDKTKIIKTYLKDVCPKLSIKYIEEKKKLGTIGAISLFKTEKKHFFVSNCDVLIDVDFSSLYKFHISNNFDITIVTCKMPFSIPYGTLNLNTKGEIKEIIEKPKNEYFVNTGLYLFKSDIIKMTPKNQHLDFNDLAEKCIKSKKRIGSYIIDESKWYDIGEWPQYEKTIRNLAK